MARSLCLSAASLLQAERLRTAISDSSTRSIAFWPGLLRRNRPRSLSARSIERRVTLSLRLTSTICVRNTAFITATRSHSIGSFSESKAVSSRIPISLSAPDDYLDRKATLGRLVCDIATEHGFPACEVDVNSADHLASGSIYLTVTGTSAEAGDDGQVGRGNRVNGLITPCRPMSLEAAAGKNPVSHVGKIYSVLARQIAEAVVAEVKDVRHAECLLVSQIGAPVTRPAIVAVNVVMPDNRRAPEVRKAIEAIAADRIARVPALIEDFVSGRIELF